MNHPPGTRTHPPRSQPTPAKSPPSQTTPPPTPAHPRAQPPPKMILGESSGNPCYDPPRRNTDPLTMITAITGELSRVQDDSHSVHLKVGPITYELLVPAIDLTELQASLGEPV